MVPGSLGCGSVVFARIAIFAPSLAHLRAMASPIPLEAPVITTVFPYRGGSFLLLLICEVIRLIRFMDSK